MTCCPQTASSAVDSGNFMGYPSMYLSVPDHDGFCFTQAYQSIGLGLASAIGSAIARPDRLTVAALGDGGALMGDQRAGDRGAARAAEWSSSSTTTRPTARRSTTSAPDGYPLDTVRFPPADLARSPAASAATAVTVRDVGDLGPVRDWLESGRDRPMLIDAKVTAAGRLVA